MNFDGNSITTERMRTVLLADDETGVRTILKYLLTRNGFQVFLAKDGLEAVQIFKDHSCEIGIVLLDVQMPLMTGPSALDRIREIAPDVRAIMTSGMDRDEIMRQFAVIPPWTFLHKPFAFEEVDQLFPKAA